MLFSAEQLSKFVSPKENDTKIGCQTYLSFLSNLFDRNLFIDQYKINVNINIWLPIKEIILI